MRIVNSRQFNTDPRTGDQVEVLQGTSAPDADLKLFSQAPVGSTYWRQVSDNHAQLVVKTKNDGRDDDWTVIQGVISERVTAADFTDGGSTAGTYTSAESIPVGAFVENVNVTNVTAFSGDTSATLIVGEADDTDRYMTGTPSVFATASAVAVGVPSGTRHHVAAENPLLTITSATDFGAVATTGALTYSLFYNL